MDQTEPLSSEQALVLAINRMGGQAAMARLLDIAQPTVWGWLNRSDKKELPAEHVLRVEAATRVSRHDLRPDIYPRGLQDGIPFASGEGIAAIGELAGGSSPEWPLTPAAGADAENSGHEFQAAEGRR